MKKDMLYDIATILVDVANKKRTITYKELSVKLNQEITPLNLGQPIGELSYISHDLGLPLISVLVVNQETRIPGDGFFKLSSELKKINEVDAMIDFQNEAARAYECTEWNRLLEHLSGECIEENVIRYMNLRKKVKKKTLNNKPKYWLIVHDITAYEENPRLLGFSDKIYNAKNIEAKDIIVYYFSKSKAIKGIYEVAEKPWIKEPRWISEHQIEITPIIELENEIDFEKVVPEISLFTNKDRWYSHIQGTNAIRELSDEDYKTIEDYVIECMIQNNESGYAILQEDDNDLINETIEVKINRMKRYQSIVNNLKNKYNNTCQIEGCNFTFKKKNGDYYSEGHHLEPLSENGSQDSSNVVILCPNHHRMFHYANIAIHEQKGNKRKVIINGENYFIIY
ncbi:HNH endonuclease [Clostridium cylindrosporum]|uniref:HNH nuclease domain-containing protein n=1 Tax=Clostridium cylindrosporum DSM 605 TaxID=1121307 RepID=A0A0J8DF64_CLOCY|nr:HNH endonuclease [Clostridium cylindrosporum]KMT22894.1 hypothetical protein CLCY_5c01330 [Clostridium cylindrosporum DSM 605]